MARDDIRPFLLALLAAKATLPEGFDEATDFLDAGIVDSIGVIKFVLELESRFAIEIRDVDIESAEFRTVRGLLAMIGRKTAAAP
jgi:acyl carrier protein